MRKLPIGIQDFVGLRQDGYLYVDKTELVHRLVMTGCAYFLSRPRRLGKSLLVSTLCALFEGRRELFEGLWIAEEHEGVEPWAFEPGPVLRLDMTGHEYRQGRGSLLEHLAVQIDQNAQRLGVPLRGTDPGVQFANLLTDAHQRRAMRVAVLVDEYDKPLLETLDLPELHREMRGALDAFYGVLKSGDAHLRFTLLTGVTKFAPVSVFGSGTNHLNDISRDSAFATLCGMTPAELERDFAPELARLGATQFRDIATLEARTCRAVDALREWYGGYRFDPKASEVCNPFSTLKALADSELHGDWFATGTPSFLIRLLDQRPMDLLEMEGAIVSENAITMIDAERISPMPLLQAGYLTIREYLPELSVYLLGHPNREVKQAFIDNLVPRTVRNVPACSST